MNTKKFSEAMNEIDDKYIEEAMSYDKRGALKKIRSTRGTIILIAAIIAILALCGFAAYQLGWFDPWLQKPSSDPIQTVQSAIENQINKEYTIRVRVDEIKVDEDETERVAAMYSGSGLAEARGWTNEYLAEHFVVVWAKYYVEYDHEKTFMDDGYTEQYFYLTQDTETGEWTISDNTSPNTHTAPNAVWEYQPLLSSKRPAFPFHFNIFPPLSIEAECDNGTLIDYENHDGTAYPHGKQLTLSSGSTLYWTPQTEGSEDFALSAEITFTVYDWNDALYTGSISIFGEKVEDSPTNAAYSATLGEGSGLTMEPAMEMNGKEVEGAIITAPSRLDGLTSSDTRLLATVYVGRGRSRLSPRNMGCGQA